MNIVHIGFVFMNMYTLTRMQTNDYPTFSTTAGHGSGGLAAQARFGATTGLAPILLGVFKILLGLFFGSSLYSILQFFPNTVMGPMLIVSAIELCSTIQFQTDKTGTFVLLFTAVVGNALDNTSVGFLAGLAAHYVLQLRAEGWRPMVRDLRHVVVMVQRDYRDTYARLRMRFCFNKR